MRLYMIRHGQSYVNLPDWTEGNLDTSLTELGQRQAVALAQWLPQKLEAIDMLYSSTIKRARETASYLAEAYDIPIQYDDRIREIGTSRADHMPWPNDAMPNYGTIWGSERPFQTITPSRTDGESMMQFAVRVGMFIEEMVERHDQETIVVVCHGRVIESMFNHAFNIGPWRRCEVFCRNTGITRFDYVNHATRETWRLLYHNRVEHLQDIQST